MTIIDLVTMAQRIHDLEGVNLGAASTRDYRNAFWARVVGCAYHGHPAYNPVPDPQWHLKSGGNGRPQSDDVAVSLPSRAYWDCIVGAGADGYRFQATGHTEPLPLDQLVYAPPVPAGSGGIEPPPPTGPSCQFVPTDLSALEAGVAGLQDDVDDLRTQILLLRDVTLVLKEAVDSLTARMEHPGLLVDASARYIGPIRGTARLPQE
jgi:hypothetical protein